MNMALQVIMQPISDHQRTTVLPAILDDLSQAQITYLDVAWVPVVGPAFVLAIWPEHHRYRIYLVQDGLARPVGSLAVPRIVAIVVGAATRRYGLAMTEWAVMA